MIEHLKKFERVIVAALILMMALVILLSVGELAWILYQDVMSPPVLILEIDELLELFGFFLLVLIGIELLETIKNYYTEGKIELTVIFTVALIALARKIIILEPDKYDPITLVGLGILILALVSGYWVTVTLRRGEKVSHTDRS
ncbi:MAG: phosphate-starvation-inducible PsiE family protein [Gammaproteobacteria bacterium]|nr:phosphate-starvation-inducible PsiE family protein [Gammaproteobacteria bacterium]